MRIKVRYGFENTEKRVGVNIQDNYVSGSGAMTDHSNTSPGTPRNKQEKPATETK